MKKQKKDDGVATTTRHEDDDGSARETAEEEKDFQDDPCISFPPSSVGQENGDEEDEVPSRAVLRKRWVASAYHKAFNAHKPRGNNKDNKDLVQAARAKAQAAHKRAGEAFDKQFPMEKK